MTINNKIENISIEIFKSGSIYSDIIDNILGYNSNLKQPMLSEIGMYICEHKRKIAKIIDENYFKYWFINFVRIQAIKKNASLYKNERMTIIKKFGTEDFNFDLYDSNEDNSDLQEKKEFEEKWELIKETREEVKVSWFDAEMFRLYYDENKTYRAIEKEYNIDHVLAFNSVKKVREKLKKHIKQKQNKK